MAATESVRSLVAVPRRVKLNVSALSSDRQSIECAREIEGFSQAKAKERDVGQSGDPNNWNRLPDFRDYKRQRIFIIQLRAPNKTLQAVKFLSVVEIRFVMEDDEKTTAGGRCAVSCSVLV